MIDTLFYLSNIKHMKSSKLIASIAATSMLAAGCATSSKDISATYVSPIQYQNFDCEQIAAENQRLVSRVSQVGGRLDEAASNDKVIMGAGLVLFWPVLFALGGTKQQEAEYGRLKGEHDALQQVAVAKKCSPLTASKEPQATPSSTQTAPSSPSNGSDVTAAADATQDSAPSK